MTTTPELLPCPFCGTQPRISRMHDESLWSHDEVMKTAVRCDGCDVSTDYTEEGQDPGSVEKWNARTQLAASAQAQQESVPMDLRAKLDKLEFDAGAGRISAMALYTRMRDLCLAYAAPATRDSQQAAEPPVVAPPELPPLPKGDVAAAVVARRGEPVARVNDEGFLVEIGDLPLSPGMKLYARAQSTPETQDSQQVEETPPHVVVGCQPTPQCTLGVGCDEAGVCYAMAHGQPDQCGAEPPVVAPPELPPLPKGDVAADTCPVMWVHSDEQTQAYARQAVAEALARRDGK